MDEHHKYLERVPIGEVKRLADRLGIPVGTLLQASLSLVEDLGDLNVEDPSPSLHPELSPI